MPEAFIHTNADELIEALRVKEKDMAAALKGEGEQVARDMQADYRRTTASWSHQVTFEKLVDTQADGSFSALVGTDDRIYGYVDQGTHGPYPIPKVAGGKMLKFKGGYRAKTTPGRIGSHGGGAFGAFKFRRQVMHPGIKPRRFTKMIFDKHKQLSLRRIARRLAEVWGK